jgi:hypothetical protein
VAWGDYDNDGQLDLAVSNPTSTTIYRNNNGTFAAVDSGLETIGLPIAWGDYDNDGCLDLVASGRVMRNQGGKFVDAGFSDLAGDSLTATAWGDYDHDGSLDLAFSGYSGTYESAVPFTTVYHNNSSMPNTPPTAPTGLSATPGLNKVTFRWQTAEDDQTPPNGLSYNLRLGTAPGAADIFSGCVNPQTGTRLLPAPGSASRCLWVWKCLPAGTYYWSVQSIDTSFAGSPWSVEQSFTVQTSKISGTVTVARGPALAGVAVGSDGSATLTDGLGNYSIWVPVGWGGTITPAKKGYTFAPASRVYNDVQAEIVEQNYTAVGGLVDSGLFLPGLSSTDRSMAWCDYDNDGDLDLAITGVQANRGPSVYSIVILRNDGGSFVDGQGR